MTGIDQADLRRRVRERLLVNQISAFKIAKEAGVPREVIGSLLAGDQMPEGYALALHSYIYYREQAEDAEQEVAGEVREKFLVREYELFCREIIKFYHKKPKHPEREFRSAKRKARRIMVNELEQFCKFMLLQRYKNLIERNRLKLSDFDNYWNWKRKVLRHATVESPS